MNQTKAAELPTVETLLTHLGDLTPQAVRLAGFPLTIQAIDQAIESGQIEAFLKTDLVSGRKLWYTIQHLSDPSSLKDKTFRVGPYTVSITNPNPSQFTFKIEGIPIRRGLQVTVVDVGSSPSVLVDTTYTVSATIRETGVEFLLPSQLEAEHIYDPNEENIRWEWEEENPFRDSENQPSCAKHKYMLSGFNLRIIIEELIRQI